MSALEVYNYPAFDGYVRSGADEAEFAAWPDLLHVGQRAPEIAGTVLDSGEQLALSSLWRRQTVVVEFGSFT